MKLIERVQLGEITAAQFEQLTGFLDAERLGLTDRVYSQKLHDGVVRSRQVSACRPATRKSGHST